MFANDFKATANVICQLTDISTSKPSIFFTAPFLYHGRKRTHGPEVTQKELLPFVPVGTLSQNEALRPATPLAKKLFVNTLFIRNTRSHGKKRVQRSMSSMYPDTPYVSFLFHTQHRWYTKGRVCQCH